MEREFNIPRMCGYLSVSTPIPRKIEKVSYLKKVAKKVLSLLKK